MQKTKHFNLLTYFLISSLLTIGLVTFYLTNHLIEVSRHQMLETKKIVTAQTAEKFNRDLKTHFIQPALVSKEGVSLRDKEFQKILDDFVTSFMDQYNLRQVNLIQHDRLILYSTRKELEGVIGKDSEAFQQAMQGNIGSKLMYNPEDQAKTSLEVFVPFKINGTIAGVTMFYQNISDVILLEQSLEKQIITTMVVGMAVLFFILFLITFKGHKTIIKQEKDLIDFNHKLEDKVKERTEELHLTNQKLQELAIKDGLTGLYNHTEIKTRFRNLLAKKEVDQLSCCMLDVDYFKKLNDTFGHPFGDEVLKHTARIINNNVRNEDLTGRYGGEEFIVLLPNTDLTEAKGIAESIRERIEAQSFVSNHKEVKITISIGISTYTNQNSFDEIIKEADQALYLAKKEGRNKVITFNKAAS